MKTIEVELRGPLDEKGYSDLITYLKQNGEYVSSQRRLFFDLSQIIGINNRELDVRAKVTNNKLQIVVKKGLVGSPSRDEADRCRPRRPRGRCRQDWHDRFGRDGRSARRST